MAEALGIASGIAGLISLTEIIVFRLSKYCSKTKDARTDVEDLSNRVKTFHIVLSKLKILAGCLENNEDDYTTDPHTLPDFTLCRTDIRGLSELTKRLDNLKVDTIKGKLLWPFKEGEITVYANKIAEHTTMLSNALTADGISALLAALSTNSKITEGVEELKLHLQKISEDMNENIRDHHQREVFEWISKADPYQKHRTATSLRHPGTVRWVFDSPEYKKWGEEENSALWLYGIPGAGKTIIASAIIQELRLVAHQHENHAVAFYYCEYGQSLTQRLVNIVGSLIKQLCACANEAFQELDILFKNYKKEATNPAQPSDGDVVKLLRRLSRHFDCIMIVIDGIDECTIIEERRAILKLLSSLNEPQNGKFKVLYTSRDEFDIREEFCEIESIPIAARGHDIELFVAARLEERICDKSLRLKNPALKERIITTIVDKADGMFQWAACQVDELCHLKNDKARLDALEKLPKDLSETYQRILNRINERKEDAELVRRILRWLAFAVDQMTWAELAHAITVRIGSETLDEDEIPDKDPILYWCGSLVSVDKQTEVFTLSHFTVKEFLMNETLHNHPKLGNYYMPKDSSTLILSQVCLTYILDKRIAQEDILEDFDFEQLFPFHYHACVSWLFYAGKQCENDNITCLARPLFEPSKTLNYILWIRRYEEMERETVSTLHVAAGCGLTSVCRILLDKGIDKDLNHRQFGTPLICAITGMGFYEYGTLGPNYSTANLLLEYGVCTTTKLKGKYIPIARTPLSLVLDNVGKDFFPATKLLEDIVAASGISSIGDSDFWEEENHHHLDTSERLRIVKIFEKILHSTENLNLDELSRNKMLRFINKNKSVTESGILDQILNAPQDHSTRIEQIGRLGQTQLIQRLIDNKIPLSNLLNALVPAAAQGHVEIVKILLSLLPPTGRQNSIVVQDAWIEAAARNEENVLQTFVELGFDTNLVINRKGEEKSAILEAVRHDCLEATIYLLSLPETDINTKIHGTTLLHQAIITGSRRVIELLIKMGLNVADIAEDGQSSIHLLFTKPNSMDYSLGNWRIDLLELLLQLNSRTDIVCNAGNSVVHGLVLLAHHSQTKGYSHIKSEFKEILDLLKVKKSILSQKNMDGRTPFGLAIFLGCLRIEEILQIIPEDTDLFSEFTCEGYYIFQRLLAYLNKKQPSKQLGQSDTYRLVSVLINKPGFDFNFKDESGFTLLQYLARNCTKSSTAEECETIRLLLEKGFPVDYCGPDGYGVLHHMAECGFQLGFATILEFTPDITLKSDITKTPNISALNLASVYGHSGIVELILADAKTKGLVDTVTKQTDKFGNSPLHLAAINGHDSTIKLLLKFGALDIDAKNQLGSTALIIAAAYGWHIVTKTLLNVGADIGSLNHHLNTPLHQAAIGNKPEIITILLEYSAKSNIKKKGSLDDFMNLRNVKGETALQIAAACGFTQVVDILLAKGADPLLANQSVQPWISAAINGHMNLSAKLKAHMDYIADRKHGSGHVEASGDDSLTGSEWNKYTLSRALMEAVKARSVPACRSFLEAGADPNIISKADSRGYKQVPLHFVAANGLAALVELLLEFGAKLNIQDTHGREPLHLAARFGHPWVTKALLERKADVFACDSQMKTPFHYAAASSSLECLETLMRHYSEKITRCPLNTTAVNGDDSGRYSIAMHDIQTSLRQVQHHNPLSMLDNFKRTPLLCSVTWGQYHNARSLIRAGSNVHTKDILGRDALYYTCKRGPKHLVELLLSTGANARAIDGHKTGVLHPFCSTARNSDKDLEIFQLLIDAGADASLVDSFGISPLHLSCDEGSLRIVQKLLMELGTKSLNDESMGFGTPIYAAAFRGHKEIVQLLIEAGADIYLGSKSEAPLEGAVLRGHEEVVEILIKYEDVQNLKDVEPTWSDLELPQHVADNRSIAEGVPLPLDDRWFPRVSLNLFWGRMEYSKPSYSQDGLSCWCRPLQTAIFLV
ncbi:ankyrin repeat protein [Phlyctema vagabunda]|uniref:Ankyrin repeat protein n=1 Tax=Phlyctema vagabunda TaxID=108571 RepID=A0ABR4PZ21_9HELO